jgi:hypothetical protein
LTESSQNVYNSVTTWLSIFCIIRPERKGESHETSRS